MNSLNSSEMAAMAVGMERGSCLWTTGVSADDLTGSGLVVSMLTVKLEGTGEGMLAELVDNMLKEDRWLF